ncbi:MAG: hypothetical protein IJ199_02785 [Prevotella sp.]|nr:hypothetical protein [Prevotella sp.]
MSEIIFISSNIAVAVMCAAVSVWMITRAYIGRAGKVRLAGMICNNTLTTDFTDYTD